MNRFMKSRNNQVLLGMLVLMGLLIGRLFSLTVVQGEEWSDAASSLSVKKIFTAAPRGQILDRYGRLLAGNKPSFTVNFSGGDLSDEVINEQALALCGILETNGDHYLDHFPIVMDGNGGFYYTYDKDIEEWLDAQGMPSNFTAEQAFSEIRRRNSIDESLDVYEAQQTLQTVYGVYPPISVKAMKFLDTLEIENFLDRYYLKHNTGAKDAFYALRKEFKIDPGLSDQEARKILNIRNEIAAQGFRKYIPATIAQNVSQKTIITIEEKNSDLIGVEVVPESVRYYPNGNTASHVLGYLGQISESEKQKYTKLGYRSSDMIGKEGIEKACESTLKGKDGIKQVQVNVNGEQTRVISDDKTEKGKDIYLTMDLELQKTAEAALKQALTAIQRGGTFKGKYGDFKYSKAYPKAKVGAVVALEVKTGDVLAMASYPDYNPNLFAAGISKEDWQALQGTNQRDPLSPVPLFNVAARTAVQPGSIFKLVTATAALESGLSPTKKLYDGGHVKVGNRNYGCLIWNTSKGSHGNINMYQAIEVSCNYYFFDLVSNQDYAKGVSLGLEKDMGIEKIMKYAQGYGLGLPTGIEIPETVAAIPTSKTKMQQTKNMLENKLHSMAEVYFKPEVVKDKETLNKNIKEIVKWTEENPSYKETLRRMQNMGLKKGMEETVAGICKYDYYKQAAWTQGDELNISIGQGENSYTPLQMANYMATMGNQGQLNQVSLIKGIEGQGLHQKPAAKKMQVKDESLFGDLIEGMKRVASGSRGSARSVFARFPVHVAAKTGTAQRDGKINPPDEVEYIKKYLPRIAPGLTWAEVEREMYRLLEEYPERYTSKDSAVDAAVIRLSDYKVTVDRINAYKAEYDPFAWFVCLAPVEDPQIAIAVLLVQGGSGGYGGPIAREIIGQYLELDKTYEDYSLDTMMIE